MVGQKRIDTVFACACGRYVSEAYTERHHAEEMVRRLNVLAKWNPLRWLNPFKPRWEVLPIALYEGLDK